MDKALKQLEVDRGKLRAGQEDLVRQRQQFDERSSGLEEQEHRIQLLGEELQERSGTSPSIEYKPSTKISARS